MFYRILNIIKKDLSIDRRERYAFISSLLYLTTIAFVVFKIFGDLEGPTRMAIFWILLLFTAIIMIGDSFSANSGRRRLNHYQLYDPFEVVAAKLILNYFKVAFAGLCLMGLFILLSSSPLKDVTLFFQIYLLGILGIVSVLTLVSSLTSYSNNQNNLISILALPLLLPVLLISMRVSLISEKMFFDTATSSNLLMLLGIDLIIIVCAFVFINFTWKP